MAPKAKGSGRGRGKASGSKAGEALAATPAYQDVLRRLKETFDTYMKEDIDDPQNQINSLKAQRSAAQQIVKEKTIELRNLVRKATRLAAKGKQMSDDGLLLEFRRRKLHKAKAAQSKLARKNALEVADEDPS